MFQSCCGRKNVEEKMDELKPKTLSLTDTQSMFGSRGVIVEVQTEMEAKRAQQAGASGLSLTYYTGTDYIKKIKRSVSIPVMVMCKVGHTGQAHILEAINSTTGGCRIVDYIQETCRRNAPVSIANGPYIDKHSFKTPFVCECTNLTEGLKRVSEGASLLKIQPCSGSGIAEALINLKKEISNLNNMDENEAKALANRISVPYGLIVQTKKLCKLPVPLFAACYWCSDTYGTPRLHYDLADAIMLMELEVDGLFVSCPSMVEFVKHYDNPKMLSSISFHPV